MLAKIATLVALLGTLVVVGVRTGTLVATVPVILPLTSKASPLTVETLITSYSKEFSLISGMISNYFF